jgi:hypothetical protein
LGEWSGRTEIVQACAGLRERPVEIVKVWGVGVWGSMTLVGLKSRTGESQIPQNAEQWLCGPVGWGLVCSASYSFSISWSGEAFHELGVQSADVSAFPGALPQSSVSPASHQSLWIIEVRTSVAVFWSPSWISHVYFFFNTTWSQ